MPSSARAVSSLTELYTPFVASSFYYLQGHHPRPDMPLRQRRRQGDRRQAARLRVASLANITLMNSHRQLRSGPHPGPRHRPDKVASVLMRVVNQLSAHGELQIDLPSPTATWRSSRTSSGPGQPGAEGLAKIGAVELGYRLIRCREPLFSSYRHLLEGRLPTTTRGVRRPSPLFAQCVDQHN